MAKLDENYLDIIRNTLYHAENVTNTNAIAPIKTNKPKKESNKRSNSVSNKKIKISPKQISNKSRKVSFKDNSDKTINVNKPRADTPFKSRSINDSFIITTKAETVSPSLSGGLEPETPKTKPKKRRLSLSNSPDIKRKKNQNPRVKLNFDESPEIGIELIDDLLCSKSDHKSKKNSKNKKKNHKSNSVGIAQDPIRSQTELNGLKCGSKIEIQTDVTNSSQLIPNKKPQKDNISLDVNSEERTNSLQKDEDDCAADFYDNDKVTVKNLKFLRFANLFQPTLCDQYRGLNYFSVPKKHYKMSKSDEVKWESEWVVTEEPATCNTNNAASTPISNKRPTENEEYNTDMLCKSFEDSVIILDDNMVENDLDNPLQSSESSLTSSPAVVINLKDSSKIVVLSDINQVVHFHGICYLKVLQGKVEILGAFLDKNSAEQKVFSPRGTSLLYVTNYNKLYSESQIKLKSFIPLNLLDVNDHNLSFPEHSAILHCRELKEHYINFIENSISQVIFSQDICTGPRVNFELKGSWNKTRYSEQWGEALENLPDMFKLALCGGKGVGKSTFLRYCINFLLGRFKKIRVIDLDPGQSEFHPSGFISAVTVDSFTLGPNYTHLQNTDRLILSHINIGHNIKQYLTSVKFLLDETSLMENLPTIINFHGFNLGIGLDISANQLVMIKPSHLFEFKSKIAKKNYKFDLTPELVTSFVRTSVLRCDIDTGDELNYTYVKLTSVAERSEAWSLEARQSRELLLLSYFGKMMSDEVKDLTSPGVNMYSINTSALKITNYEGRIISPLAINNNLVALCSMPKTNKIFVSYGYGLVRGLDLESDTLVLITPVDIETLQNVTHLVLGSVTIPPAFIMSTGGAKGHVPYVSVGDLVDFGQLTKRSYIPAKKL
ncbi:polynucleotide 5'-hydroxyl-kinase NOL9 [Anthonomus grandis grandis]|uniref:polynucleotide 5'-hydroxyl-kinase NOL9 n=1 Tax=Anthonomus grandis grandis TaxID=2921223 RepID=UPI0021650757|nr:polynucleotide 5'-hydroxyl-kinase NOL9 [Anthonomus grandis grandis]